MAKTTALGWGSEGTNALEGVPSPGISYKKSSDSSEKSDDEAKSDLSPAPTTVRRSRRGRTESGSADSTAGAGTGEDEK